MKKIMFVCTGNICRSAMAHHYMQKKLYDLKRENEIVVSSCGTNAMKEILKEAFVTYLGYEWVDIDN